MKSPSKPVRRCAWAAKEIFWSYHDTEWGVPVHDDRRLFEFLLLEGAQAGLSWSTVLAKRDAYRAAFAEFEMTRIARFGERDVKRLLGNPGIIRNALKIRSAIANARGALRLVEEHGSLDAYLWGFVGGRTIQNRRRSASEVPATTPESDAMARALRQVGFNFVGSTICYAFMQAVGMVNDHSVDCARYAALGGIVTKRRRDSGGTEKRHGSGIA